VLDWGEDDDMSITAPNSPQPQVVLTGPTPNNSQEAQDERVLHDSSSLGVMGNIQPARGEVSPVEATPLLEEVATPQAEVVQRVAGDVPPSPLDVPRTPSQSGLRLSVPPQESVRRSPRLLTPPPLRRSPRGLSPSPNGGTKRKGSPTSGEDGGLAKKAKQT
jgi:hypothetical protein